MSKEVFSSLFSFFLIAVAVGQTIGASGPSSVLMEKMGTEGVYVHYNTNVLFSGEYLNFKLYSLGKTGQAPLLLSKFAYVELIDVEGERVMIEKVKMIDGQGQGDFFIPTTLESGYYSLVAYTNYMRNWESSTFYKDQLLVINPYTNNQHVFWKSGVAGMDSGVDSVNNQYVSGYSYSLSNNQNAGLKISTDKLRYGTREKVELTIDSNPDSRGTYSVSIRKSSDLLRYKPKVSPVEYLAHYRSLNSDNITSNIYLPELRGELFRGKLIGDDGRGVANQKVIVSLPGKQYELKIIPTDGSGDFIFSLDSKNLEPRAIFQVLGTDRTDFDIEILELPELKIGNNPHVQFFLNKEMEREIVDRSIYNQIENAYFNKKPDTVQLTNIHTPKFVYDIFEYNLDDYTRFPTFQETLVEIVAHVWIASGPEGKRRLFVRDYEGSRSDTGYNPLVIVDGIVVQDHEELIGFDVNRIKSIGLGRNHYAISGQIFQGIIDVETFDSNFLESYSNPNMIEILRPLPEKKYFRQVYGSDDTLNSIPDFRHQLLWEPNLELDNTTTKLVFHTSDVKGDFEIVIEGFTNQMKPIRVVTHFMTH